jgi:hypothetical protein
VPGDRYLDADGRYVLRYAGAVPAAYARALPGVVENFIEATSESEPVLLFEVVSPEGTPPYYTHTRSDADRGYGFVKLVNGDHVGDSSMIRRQSSADPAP